MALDFDLLHKIHRLLKRISEIRDQIARGPIKIKMIAANEANFLAELESAKDAVTKTRMACDKKQLQLDEREAKIEDMKIKLHAADSNKEFQLLKERIAADEQANSVLQDEILEQLEKLDQLISDRDQAKSNFEKAQLESQQKTEKVELEIKAQKLELERITNELAESESQLPRDLVGEYRRLVTGMGEDALGQTNTETCGNCNRRLTTQMAAELLMKKPLICQGCGCLLYVVEAQRA